MPFAFLAAVPDAARLPFEMMLVFGCAKLLDELFERFGQPGIVGQILAGVFIGPSVLGWIAPNEFLRHLAELGVMFLLFRVGLEVKSSDLKRVGAVATAVAVLGVIVPFFLGWGILLAWGERQIGAIFVGAAMVATSVGITAQVLASKGLLAATASRMILAAAVIDDVLGLLILALVSSVAKGSVNVFELALTAVLAIGFTLIVLKWGQHAMDRVLPRVDESFRAAEAQFVLAMMLLFTLAFLAVHAGVAAIIGAFLAGVALAESAGRRVHDLTQGATELLVPFFLFGIGLHFKIALFSQLSTLLLASVILFAAILSKLVGCGLAAWKLGRPDAIRVGIGMIPRGEVGMVVAQIGLTMGVVGEHLYGVVVFMSVMTTLIAPPLLNLAFRGVNAVGATEDAYRLG